MSNINITRKILTLKKPIIIEKEEPVVTTPKKDKKYTDKKALTFLYDTYPKLFNENKSMPLKVGIFEDILEDIKQKELSIPTKAFLRRMLNYYIYNRWYQSSIINNEYRYDLEGNQTTLIPIHAKQHAFNSIKSILKRKGKWEAAE